VCRQRQNTVKEGCAVRIENKLSPCFSKHTALQCAPALSWLHSLAAAALSEGQQGWCSPAQHSSLTTCTCRTHTKSLESFLVLNWYSTGCVQKPTQSLHQSHKQVSLPAPVTHACPIPLTLTFACTLNPGSCPSHTRITEPRSKPLNPNLFSHPLEHSNPPDAQLQLHHQVMQSSTLNPEP
jgi:hypothetical protein